MDGKKDDDIAATRERAAMASMAGGRGDGDDGEERSVAWVSAPFSV